MRTEVFDTETTGLDWDRDDRPFMVQWADGESPLGNHALMGPAAGYATSNGMLPGADLATALRALELADEVVGHNLPFDVHMMREGIGVDLARKRLKDTKVLAPIVNPERRFAEINDPRGYHLKDLAHDYVDQNAKDSEAILEELAESHGFKLKASPSDAKWYRPAAYYELWKLEPEAMEFYGREDARLTRGLLPALEAKLTAKTRQIWELEQRVTPIIINAEAKGIRVDSDKALPLRVEYTHKAEESRAALDAQLMDGWADNNDNLAEALLKVGVPLTEKTASGEHLATNKKALAAFEQEFPVIKTLFEYRLAEKFVSTYLDHFVNQEVIHPVFNQIGTWTGRMSSLQPNMQNVPTHVGEGVRELFVPRDGYAFVAVDYEQIEFRLLCYYLNGRRMIELMESGHDPFAQLAADVFGGHPAEWYRKGQPGEELRQICKNVTYAIIYGAGGYKVATMLGWGADSVFTDRDFVVRNGYKKAGDPRSKRAEGIIKRIKSALTGYGSPPYHGPGSGAGLIGRIHDQVAQTGQVNTILGRNQWVDFDGAHLALSGLIQGGAADVFKEGIVAATESVAPLGAYPLLFIHDEGVFEAPIGTEQEVERRARAAMVEAYPLRPALAVESHIAYHNWGEAK